MRNLITIIFLIFTLYSTSQSNCDCFQRLSGLAKLQSYEGKNFEALQTYKRALTFLPDSVKNYSNDYQLSMYYLQNTQLDSATHYLIKSIEEGFIGDFKNDVRLDSLLLSPYRDQIESAHRKKPNEKFDWSLYNSIQRLQGIDQSIRKKNGIGGLAKDSLQLYEHISYVDSIIFEKVIELINLHGYPTQKSHGFTESYMVYFLHSSMYSEQKFQIILNHLKKQYELCLCHKSDIAFIKDRRLDWYYRKKQVAGTWNYPGEFLPIENISVVDSIRFEYNLLNLYDYGRITGRSVPENYIKHEYPKNYFCDKITLPNKK